MIIVMSSSHSNNTKNTVGSTGKEAWAYISSLVYNLLRI